MDNRGTITGIRGQTVLTKGGAFRVGTLSPEWKQTRFDYKALVFTHERTGATISVDSFCKGSFDDATLPVLSNDLFYGMTEQSHPLRQSFMLAGREALKTTLTGKMDGVRVAITAVVTKHDECVYDFVLASEPTVAGSLKSDFDHFVGGLEF